MTESQTPADWDLKTLLTGYARVAAEQNVAVYGLCMDSRNVQDGDVFFATAGAASHGLDYIDVAVAQGAVAVVYEPTDGLDMPSAVIPLVAVEHLSARAGELANRFYFEASEHLALVGITGTNGKTSVSHYLAQALTEAGMPCALVGTLGVGFHGALEHTGYTTPDAVSVHKSIRQLKRQGAQALAMEVSSHALVQGRVNAVHFDVAVFTNLSRDHLDYHGDMEAYGEAKRRLIEMPGLRAAVINLDDELGRRWLERMPADVSPVPFSLSATESDEPVLTASHLSATAQGNCFELSWQGETVGIETSLMGDFNVQNLLATAGAMLALGYPLKRIAPALKHVTPVSGRMETLSGAGKPLAVVDFAHTPDALEKALVALRKHCAGTLVCVFGCGGDRDAGKRPEMAKVAEHMADVVVVTDDNPRTESPEHIANDILQGFVAPASVRVIHDRREAILCALEECGVNDAVLVAGKGHESYQLIGKEKLPFSDQDVITHWMGGAA